MKNSKVIIKLNLTLGILTLDTRFSRTEVWTTNRTIKGHNALTLSYKLIFPVIHQECSCFIRKNLRFCIRSTNYLIVNLNFQTPWLPFFFKTVADFAITQNGPVDVPGLPRSTCALGQSRISCSNARLLTASIGFVRRWRSEKACRGETVSAFTWRSKKSRGCVI